MVSENQNTTLEIDATCATVQHHPQFVGQRFGDAQIAKKKVSRSEGKGVAAPVAGSAIF
jgi:hypothetical protein